MQSDINENGVRGRNNILNNILSLDHISKNLREGWVLYLFIHFVRKYFKGGLLFSMLLHLQLNVTGGGDLYL